MANKTVKGTKAIASVFVIALLGLCVLSACGSQQTQETQGGSVVLVDSGPNAQLGNKELLAAATSNMKSLNSFHVQFTERTQDVHWDKVRLSYQPNTATELSSTITIEADIQEMSKGSHFKLTYEDTKFSPPDQEFTMINMLGREHQTTDLLVKGKELYESRDGGITWGQHGPGSAGFAIMPVVMYTLPVGNSLSSQLGGADYLEYLSKDLVFEDGNPRLEKIDGMLTRHIVANVKKPTPGSEEDENPITNPWVARAESIDLWISTDATPKLIQMRVVVRSVISKIISGMSKDWPDQVRYAFNWRWSRFNEDLSMIEAPITPTP